MATRGSEERDRGRERILVVCTRYIGDTVLAIPFLRNLRRAFPDAVIDICAEGPARGVLADCPYVDDLVSWTRPGRRGPVAALAAIRTQAAWLAGRRYTRAYLLKRSLSAGLLVTLAGIPVRVGLAGDGRWLLTRAVTAARGRHQAARYLDLLRAEGIDVDDGHSETGWRRLPQPECRSLSRGFRLAARGSFLRLRARPRRNTGRPIGGRQ